MIAGPTAHICDKCIEFCNEIILEYETRGGEESPPDRLPKPFEINAFLDQYVIGQKRAKKILSVAIYNHYKRTRQGIGKDEVEIQKSNVLLIGSTGTGKTLLAQTLARLLKVPFTIADATSLTEAGYVGEDVENIILNLLQAAEYDIARAEMGIVYLDEIDKIAQKPDLSVVTRDVAGEGVQQGLLKIIEGTLASIPPKGGRKHPQQDFIRVNTNNVLFICGGAFEGLDKIVQNRIGRRSLGFGADIHGEREAGTGESLAHVQPEDLMAFGLIPELVGRLPVIAALEDLALEALVQIMTEPKNALVKQYQRLLAMEGVKLRITKRALAAIARQALKKKTGARGLRSIMETFMLDIMFEVPSRRDVRECVIGEEVIEKGEAPLLVQKRRAAHA